MKVLAGRKEVTRKVSEVIESAKVKNYCCKKMKEHLTVSGGLLTFNDTTGSIKMHNALVSEEISYCPFCGSEVVRIKTKDVYDRDLDSEVVTSNPDWYGRDKDKEFVYLSLNPCVVETNPTLSRKIIPDIWEPIDM